jgi:hypothetical protein
MCYFITATLSADAKIEKVFAVAKKYNFAWIEQNNTSVQKQIDAGSSYFCTTMGQCDCGTLLGSANRYYKNSKNDFSSKILNFRKKGWSETKIERWLSEKKDLSIKNESNSGNSKKFSEIESWKNFVVEVLNSKFASKIGVLLHMYSGSICTEPIELLGKIVIKLKNVNEEVFLTMYEDHLYEFVKS